MLSRNKGKSALFIVALILGIAGIIMAFTGLPGTMDTEPVLAVGVICLAVAGLLRD
jgi:hypothetical protein